MKGNDVYMRFTPITNELKEALFDFFMEQDECMYEYTEDEVMDMLDSVYTELDKVKNGVLPVTSMNRFDCTVSSEELMPPDAAENTVLCEEAVHLASVIIDEYTTDDGKKTVRRSYDIIYDAGDEIAIPVYTITVSDSDMTAVYRVECDFVEDFKTTEFMITLAVQLADKLRNAAEFLGKVGDFQCV